MATYTIYSDTSDGELNRTNSDYATAAAMGSSSLVLSTETTFRVGQQGTYGGSKQQYTCFEGFLSFNTSDVSGTCTSVTLSLNLQTDNTTYADFTLNARAYDWGSTLEAADGRTPSELSALSLRASRSTSTLPSVGSYWDLTSDSSFTANIASPVRLVLSSSRHESQTAPAAAAANNEYAVFYAADQSGTSNDPKLVIVTQDADPMPVSAIMAPRIPVEAY